MTCGAAVRGRARFCPQCGTSTSEAPTLSRGEVETPMTAARPAATAAVPVAPAPPKDMALRVNQSESGAHAMARSERFREISSGVLDDAADDPGARFVLIACALFALFVIILIFSYILK